MVDGAYINIMRTENIYYFYSNDIKFVRINNFIYERDLKKFSNTTKIINLID